MKLHVLGGGYGTQVPFKDQFDDVLIISCLEDLAQVAKDDVLMFEGGTDISTSLYNEKKAEYTSQPDTTRDAFESEVFDKMVGHAKFFGICRGSQFLCAKSGGKLVQHVTGHSGSHMMEFRFEPEQRTGKCLVSSTHHQMMYSGNLPGSDYHILGWADSPKSDRYEGFLHGAYNCFNVSYEPEVLYFKKTRALAMQYHPEFMGMQSMGVEVARQYMTNLLTDVYATKKAEEPVKKLSAKALYQAVVLGDEAQVAPPRARWGAENGVVFNANVNAWIPAVPNANPVLDLDMLRNIGIEAPRFVINNEGQRVAVRPNRAVPHRG